MKLPVNLSQNSFNLYSKNTSEKLQRRRFYMQCAEHLAFVFFFFRITGIMNTYYHRTWGKKALAEA